MNPYEVALDCSEEHNIRGYERGTANPSVAIWPAGDETSSQRVYRQPLPVYPPIHLPFGDVIPTASVGRLLVDLRSKFERERDTFLRLKESLLETHRGRFVAIHREAVVGIGDDERQLAERVYAQHGYVPIYIGRIERTRRVIEMPSPEGL